MPIVCPTYAYMYRTVSNLSHIKYKTIDISFKTFNKIVNSSLFNNPGSLSL